MSPPPFCSSNRTRVVRIGSIEIGGGRPVAVQSMCATRTSDLTATAAQTEQLRSAGADVVRVAADTSTDAAALAALRQQTAANLSVDLQENYRLVADVAPHVDKVRYNPGHLYHHGRSRPWQDKVRLIVDVAARHDCALRVGVNCGSVDPAQRARFRADDWLGPMLQSALDHCDFLDRLGYARYCVSLKDSDPEKVVAVNRRFAALRPDVPLHLGVTEAGMPPEGVLKTRRALGQLLSEGIGDTLRVSLTLPFARKHEEIIAGRQLLEDLAAGRWTAGDATGGGLNIISCPSCSRVENEAFIELAEQVRRLAQPFDRLPITIAVMGCRVNGPGETDHAELGLWCGPTTVNLKRGGQRLGAFSYQEILPRLREELTRLAAERGPS